MAYWGYAFFDSGVRFDAPNEIPITSMRTLSRFLEVPFDDPNISLDELTAFTTDHLERIIAMNPNGEWDARIAATQAALGLLEDCTSDDGAKLALRKARKMAKESYREQLAKKVAMIHAVVVAKFGPDSTQLAECFPQGRSAFTKATDDRVDNHLEILITGLTAHQAELGAQVVTDATTLKTGWDAVYTASESSTGARAQTQEGKRMARENLQLMLFLNLLKIAEMFPRQPQKLALYMQQSLLEDHPISQPEPPQPPTPPGP